MWVEEHMSTAEENAELKRTPVVEPQEVRKGRGEAVPEGMPDAQGEVRQNVPETEAHGPSRDETRPPAENPAHRNPAKLAARGTNCPSVLELDLTPKEKAKYVEQVMINILAVTGEEYLRTITQGADPEKLKSLATTIATMQDVVQSMLLAPLLLDVLKGTGDPSSLTKGKTGALVAKLAGKAQGIKKLKAGDKRTTPEKLKAEVLGPTD
jgi:hypothetical protein